VRTGKRRERRTAAAVLVAGLACMIAAPTAASAATITVTGAGDLQVNNGLCSLREAITSANTNAASGAMPGECAAGDPAPAADEIGFSIGGAGPHVITPNSAPPSVTEVAVIDGGTQPAGEEIRLDGASAGNVTGVDVEADGVTVEGLTVVSFSFGIDLAATDGATVRDALIGIDPAGTDLGNSVGVAIDDPATTDAEVRDSVVSGNSTGIRVEGEGIELRGNLVGTDPAGTAAVPNSVGIQVRSATGTQIGGPSPGQRNVISGNDGDGIRLGASFPAPEATATRIEGNYIGTDVSGSVELGNLGDGVYLAGGSSDNVVGSPGAGNVIAGSGADGILIADSPGNVLQANLIGVGADGTTPLGNEGGIQIESGADGNLIGGTGPGEGNVIAHGPNFTLGVEVNGGPTGNSILGNSIHSNGDLGIDLEGDGLTPNDGGAADDADVGSNDLQNFPELDSAQTNSVDTSVQGTLDTKPNRTYRVELFSNPACDASGNGEGRTFLGARNVQTNGAGEAQFDATVAPSSAGDQLTATATDLGSEDTSEFSACVVIGSKPEPPSPSPPPPAADPPDTAVALDVDAKRRQRAGKLKLEVSCGSEPCEVEASGKAVAKKKKGGGKRRAAAAAKKRSYRLKGASASPGANETRTLRLKLRKHSKSVKKLRTLLKRKSYRKRSQAKIELSAADAAGNAATEKVTVKLRP